MKSIKFLIYYKESGTSFVIIKIILKNTFQNKKAYCISNNMHFPYDDHW